MDFTSEDANLKTCLFTKTSLRWLWHRRLAHVGMKLYQMDVKSVFLNGFINELVYVDQPPGFEDPRYHNHVYRLSKALYGLKQAPRAWYERLRDFLIEKGFTIGKVDTTLFTKKLDGHILFIKCMLMISSLDHQIKILAKSLVN